MQTLFLGVCACVCVCISPSPQKCDIINDQLLSAAVMVTFAAAVAGDQRVHREAN